MTSPGLPSYRMIEYRLNIESGWYERQPQKFGFAKLPEKLRVEKTQDPRIIANGASEVITGGFRAKRRTFFTGVIPLYSEGWYQGNDYEHSSTKKVNSLVLFRFLESDSRLVVFYFTGYYIHSSEQRLQFSNHFSFAKSKG